MPRYRRLIAALGIIAAVVVVLVVVDMIRIHAPGPSASKTDRDYAAQRRTSRLEQPSEADLEFPDDEFGKVTEPPPAPNVTGIVVDEAGNPIAGALVSACHLVPYLEEQLDTEDLEGEYDFGPEPEEDEAEREEDLQGDFGPDDPDEYELAEETYAGDELVDESGMPIRVGVPWGKAPQCLTDENGAFALHVCDKLWYGMTVCKKGYDSPVRVFHEPQEGIRLVLYGPGSLVGRVLDASTGEPVPHFTVTLSWGGGFDVYLEPAEESRILVDNERGEFRLDEIPSDLSLEINAEGYLPEKVGSIEPIPGRTITTKIRMHRAARLVGQVVWASNDQPVADSVVQVKTSIRRFDLPYEYFPSVASDEKGMFELPMLPAGRATVFVVPHEEVFFTDLADSSAELAAEHLHSEAITLPPGETTHVVLRVLDKKPGKIQGRVIRGETGEPMPGISISLNNGSTWGFRPAAGGGAWGLQPTDQLTTESDTEGRFEFANLEPETYELTASNDNYAMKEQPLVCLKSGETVEGLVVELYEWACLGGSVRDTSGKPVEATVFCSAGTHITTHTDDKGNYEFERVIPGHATAHCYLPGKGDWFAERLVETAPGKTTRADFVLPETYSITGRITVAKVPIQRATLYLYSDLSATDLTLGVIGGPDDRVEEAKHEGRFRIRNVPPGKYSLFVDVASGMLIARVPVEVVAADVEVNLELPTGLVTGRVFDAESGEPVPRALVSICKEQDIAAATECAVNVEPTFWVWTDPYTGSYTFAALNDGRYVITASKDEYGVGRTEIDVIDGKQIGNGDILLSDGCEVRCTIATEQADAGASNVVIIVRDSSERFVTTAGLYTDSESEEYPIGYLRPGDYVLEANSETTAWQCKELTVIEGARNVVDFRLPEGNTLVVKVRDAAGEPVHGAIPNIKDAEGRNRVWRTGDYEEDWNLAIQSASDGHGVTCIEHLLPGTYSLTVEAAGYKGTEQSVEIHEGGETEIEVRLEPLPADEIMGRYE